MWNQESERRKDRFYREEINKDVANVAREYHHGIALARDHVD